MHLQCDVLKKTWVYQRGNEIGTGNSKNIRKTCAIAVTATAVRIPVVGDIG
jgi:hypothetical protein